MDNGPDLLAKNVRVFLGDSEVNNVISETIAEDPKNFWYFNNGITVLCNSFEKSVAGGSDRSQGSFTITGASVVNGAQTVGTLAAISRDGTFANSLNDTLVMVRIIELSEVDEDFGSRVTRATNTQNRIGGRDFVGLDPEQSRIKDEFDVDGLEYLVRNGESLQNSDRGCTFDEAIVGLACANGDVNLSTTAKREVSRLYVDTGRAPYRTLFNSKTTSESIWRRVGVMRTVDKKLKSMEKDASSSRDKGFAIHGNRLILHLVFTQIENELLDNPAMKWDNSNIRITELTEKAYSAVQAIVDAKFDGYLAATFKNSSKVKVIREEALSILASSKEEYL